MIRRSKVMRQAELRLRSRSAGVTMLELLVVLAIIAIIASFAFPSYMNYVAETKRTAATATLLQIADRQQYFFMDNKSFASDLTDLGYSSDPVVISDDNAESDSADMNSIYSISLSDVTNTTFTLTAAPLHGQLERDADCGSLTLDQAGVRGSAGNDCWN